MKDISLDNGSGKTEDIKKSLVAGLNKIFPIESNKRKLSIENIWFGRPNFDGNSWKDINDAHKSKSTIGLPYHYDMVITDKESGKTISRKKVKGGTLPTKVPLLMGSFMVDGNAYSIPLQDRLKPGAYARLSETGEAEVYNNIKGSTPLRTTISPERGIISLKIRQGSVPLYPLLKLMGIKDEKIKSTIGNELFDKNATADYGKNIMKVHKIMFSFNADSLEDAEQNIKHKFASMSTSPEVNKRTLGDDHKNIDGHYLLDTAKKVVNITRGIDSPDNRDSLINKSTMGIDDILKDSLERSGKMSTFSYKARWKMNHTDDASKMVNPKKIDEHVKQIFTSSKLSRYADQTNPASMISENNLTTVLGEGGIGSKDVVTQAAKKLQNSHAGFIDPVKTPESYAAGISLTLAKDTKKIGNELATKVIDVKTGGVSWLPVSKTLDTPVAFPGEFINRGGKWVAKDSEVDVIYNDDEKSIDPSKVRYMIHSPSGMFDISTNMIPFIQSNQANRLLTGTKMSAQAVPLVEPEKPLVETVVDGIPMLDAIGDKFSTKAKQSGTVSKVTKDIIEVTSGNGTSQHSIPSDVPLNEKSFIDAIVKVKKGDKVKKGQLLADSTFTRDGKYVNGVNLVTAYTPWQGLNHEDSAVITESAAKKLKSLHVHKITLPKKHNLSLNLEKYKAYNPYVLDKIESGNYDKDGVIKPGTTVKTHDLLIAAMEDNVVTGADSLIAKMKKSSIQPFKDASVSWRKSPEGKVIDVVKDKDAVKVYIKTTEPFKVADKIVGRHGNKVTVSSIIPDKLAPVTESGEKVELIIDPLSVPSRINIGQLIETAAGKVADKKKSPYLVNNFDGSDHRKQILDIMKDIGIKETEDIFDPATGATIPNILVGKQYINKLKHQVEHKMSSRGVTGPYTYNNQPIAGSGRGGMAFDNLTTNVLLSHGAKDILREGFNVKNNPNTDYWRAIQHGEVPPAPTTSYEWKKFESLLKGMGINTKKKGSSIKLAPMTDKDVLDISKGEIESPIKTFRGKGASLTPDKHGLFGDNAGGFMGQHFNHIKLNKPIPNPAFKEGIKAILRLTDKEFEESL